MKICLFLILLLCCWLIYKNHYLTKQLQIKKEYENNLDKKFQEQEEKIAQIGEQTEKSYQQYLIFENQIKVNRENLETEIALLIKRKQSIEEEIKQSSLTLTQLSENQKIMVRDAFKNYCEILDKEYEDKEEEYHQLVNNLNESYSILQTQKIEELQEIETELNKLKATKQALHEAQIREQEIADDIEKYSLNISENELTDIYILEQIKPKLNQPRILSMLIWSTFYQKPMTTLCNNLLGLKPVCGIYKITNQKDQLSYIGQSVDIAKRWKEHAKSGLGIDTPAGNKLYKAMLKDGLNSFSWELLETCERDELDEKEQYYIDLYQTKDYGYNSTIGVNKKKEN